MRPAATTTGEPRGRTPKTSRAASMAMRALRGARDLYVRGLRGLDRFVAAANPRAGVVGRPTSRVFGVVGGGRGSEEELGELVRSMQARRVAVRSEKVEAGAPVVRLESINEDATVVHPTSR